MATTVPRYVGESRDGRTNRWKVACPKCGKEFEPETTRLASQLLDCPARKCEARMIAHYNDDIVVLVAEQESE